MSKVKVTNVNLDLLKKLVSELDALILSSEALKKESIFDKDQYLVELSKAAGVCSGIFQESALLVADIASCASSMNNSNESLKTDLSELFPPLKGNVTN
jgi:hypothetical protein